MWPHQGVKNLELDQCQDNTRYEADQLIETRQLSLGNHLGLARKCFSSLSTLLFTCASISISIAKDAPRLILTKTIRSEMIHKSDISREKERDKEMSTQANAKSEFLKATNGEVSTRRAILTVGLIFVASLTALFYVYMSFPELEKDEKQYMKLPFHIEDAKNLGKLLERYKDLYYFQVLAGLFITYIFLQTFAIPGSIFLSILSGFLFRFPIALLLVCTCSAVGATLCYLLSSLLGRRLLYRYFPDKAKEWTITVARHRHNLLNYMLFLRMTPLLPNWFINLASPVIGVPMVPFTVGTFFGVAPPSFVAIQAGQTLHKLTSSSDAWSWNSIIILCVFASFSLLPVLYKQKLKQKFE